MPLDTPAVNTIPWLPPRRFVVGGAKIDIVPRTTSLEVLREFWRRRGITGPATAGAYWRASGIAERGSA